MPFIIAAIGFALKPIVFRVLAFLGIGLIIFSGGEILVASFADALTSQITALPPQVAQIFGILNVDKFVTIIISAYSAKLAYRSATGAFKKIGVR